VGVGLSFSQYKHLIFNLGKDSHNTQNRPLHLSTSMSTLLLLTDACSLVYQYVYPTH
jgi:hypothetical protein